MTRELFREDAYLRECEATVTAVDEHGFQADQTVFYPMGGGQPGDTGTLILPDGHEVRIKDTVKHPQTGASAHIVDDGCEVPEVGQRITLSIDWQRRYRLMRMHSCMHLLCATIPAPVTGGQIADGRGRLDFDLPEPVDKLTITTSLQELIGANQPMSARWVTTEQLQHQPELVRTMSVAPPVHEDRIRLVEFAGIDLQACGGTHVASTAEIGDVYVRKIEKKGKQNRRVIVEFGSGV